MSASVIVCKGCCCGRIEKGNKEVPVEALRAAWEEHGLAQSVKLTISGCLGPCSMNNVSILKTNDGNTWLGKLNAEEHYQALVGWACDIAQNGNKVDLPEILQPLQFDIGQFS